VWKSLTLSPVVRDEAQAQVQEYDGNRRKQIAPIAHGVTWRERSIQRLNLRLLIDTEHDGVVGRIRVQADDVADVFRSATDLRQFERFAPLRLQFDLGRGLGKRTAEVPI
jgi:hypothetical protein